MHHFLFRKNILPTDFDKVFLLTVDEPFKHFESLYDDFISILKKLDTPFVLFPTLDVLQTYTGMQSDYVNALKISEDAKQKFKGLAYLEKGLSALTTFTFGGDKKEEEEGSDLDVHNETEEQQDTMTKKVESLKDKIRSIKRVLIVMSFPGFMEQR